MVVGMSGIASSMKQERREDESKLPDVVNCGYARVYNDPGDGAADAVGRALLHRHRGSLTPVRGKRTG
jgi:hypothetical protein